MLPESPQKRFLLGLFIFALVIGIGARVAHLDRKLFWQDEAVAALHVSGHSWAEYFPLFDGRVHSLAQVRSFVELDRSTTLGTVFKVLSVDDPHLGPLFYILDRWTLEAIGGGAPGTFRLPSVIVGILSIGFAFALGVQLFRSRTGGAVLAGLVALSPFHILYARQTREYALFGTLVFAANLCLLRALDGRKPRDWAIYAVTVALGMYTDPLFALVVGAHAAIALAGARRNLRGLLTFFAAAAAGLLAYVPWALNAFRGTQSVAAGIGWGFVAFPVKLSAEKWAFNTGAVFFDAEFADMRLVFIAVLALAIAALSIVVVARASESRVRTFAFTMTIVPVVPFILFDAIHGAHYATIPRYLTAGWIGLELCVAGAIVSAIKFGGRAAFGAYAAFAFLVAAGALSAIIDNGAENWWDNDDQVAYQAVARRINTTPQPLIVSYDFHELPLLISNYVRPGSSFLLYLRPHVPDLPPGTRQAYLLVPVPAELATFQARDGRRYRITNVSPLVANAITEFHDRLAKDKQYGSYGTIRVERPDNALWSLVPR